jgi:hypothetical protein
VSRTIALPANSTSGKGRGRPTVDIALPRLRDAWFEVTSSSLIANVRVRAGPRSGRERRSESGRSAPRHHRSLLRRLTNVPRLHADAPGKSRPSPVYMKGPGTEQHETTRSAGRLEGNQEPAS